MNRKYRILLWQVLLIRVALLPAHAALKPLAPRQVLSLDGTWQIEQGGMNAPPDAFTRTVPVPGLVDLATPEFTEVGKVSAQRQAFWYRRCFRVDRPLPEIALLKLHKARYGSTVWLNGKLLGQHMPCFTPVEFDAHALLRQGENELLIRIGANRESIPSDQPSGWDFEKYLYTPGLYDSVELILSGAPYLRTVQTVPDPVAKSVRIVAEVVARAQPAAIMLRAEVVSTKTDMGAAGPARPPCASPPTSKRRSILPFHCPKAISGPPRIPLFTSFASPPVLTPSGCASVCAAAVSIRSPSARY